MELKALTCPNCGGKVNLDPSNEKGFCIFCGSEIIIAEAMQRFKGEIDGVATNKSRIIRAKQMIDDGDLDGAMKTYRQLLDSDPTNHEAWWGLFQYEVVVAEYYRNQDGANAYSYQKYAAALSQAVNSPGQRALEYAPPELRGAYQAGINEIQNRINSIVLPRKKSGCYIATAVYGSYNAPEVITLRKFRDEVLARSVSGRAFIRTYYLLSPPVARWLRGTKRVNLFVKDILDQWIARLKRKGTI